MASEHVPVASEHVPVASEHVPVASEPVPSDPVPSEHWKEAPEAEDFPSAESYLSLLVGTDAATKLAKTLRKHKALSHFAAKDILRAAGLPLLPADDSEVSSDLEKVRHGKKLSPVLLVQGEPLWVADGYHRVCASYHLDEKTPVPCRIVPRSA